MMVLDASIAIKWFLVEPETPAAIKIAREILQGKRSYFVPESFYFEVFAVVSRKHRNPRLWCRQGVRWLLNLPLHRIPLTRDLAERMEYFVARGLTGYDAAYAALAHWHGGKWLTFDASAKAVLGSPSWIIIP